MKTSLLLPQFTSKVLFIWLNVLIIKIVKLKIPNVLLSILFTIKLNLLFLSTRTAFQSLTVNRTLFLKLLSKK